MKTARRRNFVYQCVANHVNPFTLAALNQSDFSRQHRKQQPFRLRLEPLSGVGSGTLNGPQGKAVEPMMVLCGRGVLTVALDARQPSLWTSVVDRV